jgi:hypothetical protein
MLSTTARRTVVEGAAGVVPIVVAVLLLPWRSSMKFRRLR